MGNKAHLTESCDEDLPHLVIGVLTTSASQPDQVSTAAIWEDWAARDLLPSAHLLDTGYVDAPGLLAAQERGMTLVGPVQADSSWQARAKAGYAAADFVVDWERQRVLCPQGKESHTWVVTADGHGGQVLRIRVALADCCACPARTLCTQSTTSGRSVTLLPTQALYQARAGIEGTISQGGRRVGLRQARYRGEAKLPLQHCAEAAALTTIRLVDFLRDRPRAHTRRSHLARVLPPAA